MTFSLIFPDSSQGNSNNKTSFSDFEFVNDLRLDTLIRIKNNQWTNKSNLGLKGFFITDPEIIEYRMELFAELFNKKELADMIIQFMPKIEVLCESCAAKDAFIDTESSLLVIKEIELYIECMDFIGSALSKVKVSSKALIGLQHIVSDVVNGEQYKILKSEVSKLSSQIYNIKSITVGVNLDAQYRPTEAGILSINDKPVISGSVIDKLLRLNTITNGLVCISPLSFVRKGLSTQETTAINVLFMSALNRLINKSVQAWRPVIKQYLSIASNFLVSLFDEFRFVSAVIEFLYEMKTKGFPLTRPVLCDSDEEIKNLYNPLVALKMNSSKEMSLNDLHFDNEGRIYILTGSNMGGKSVFTHAVGLAYALLHLGVLIPAAHARLRITEGIFTHFPKQDENEIGKSRFSEECSRVGRIAKQLTKNSVFLFDEALSGTNGNEAEYIAGEVLTAFGIKGVRGIFSTHLHGLVGRTHQFNKDIRNQSKIDNLCVASKKTNEIYRPYTILRDISDGLSYAKDIADKYGLTVEEICN